MKHTVVTIFLLFSFFILPGCYRYIYWAESILDQGCKIETCACVVQPYIRSARVYDQFTTLGLFDALWIHDQVILANACAYASKYGLSSEQYDEYLQKQREEFSPYISFYLLTVIPGNIGVLLTDENPIWTIQLKLGNDCFKPSKIKMVELSQEYRYFFGKRLTVFKKQYLIQFDAVDANNVLLLNPSVQRIELIFRSIGHQTGMCWNLDNQLRAIDYCPLDDDTLAYDINTNI
jgi:hypothetical protein